MQVKNGINIKQVLNRIHRFLLKAIKGYLSLINPRNIVKSYINEFKSNRLSYSILMIGIVFLFILRIGCMETNITPLIQKVTDEMLVGGDDIPDQLQIPISGGVVSDVGASLYGIMNPIGMSFCVMYWLIMVVNAAVRDNFSPEQIALLMAKLIIPIIIIDHGYSWSTELIKIGNNILDDMKATLTITAAAPSTPPEMEVPLAKYLSVLIPAYLLWGVGTIGRIAVLLAIYARQIRLALLIGFAPFSLADISGDEHSQSVRMMKEILAVALQGVVILAINYAGYQLLREQLGAGSGTVVENLIANDFNIFQIVGAIAVSVTAIGLYAKSSEISKSIVGL